MEEGFNTGDRLEVSLVHQNKLADTNAIFFAEVMGAGTNREGRRFLRLKHEDNSWTTVGTRETLFLDEYQLLSITWKPDRLAPMDTVQIEANAEAQNEGYEVICHILEQAGIEATIHEEKPAKTEEPSMSTTRKGPRRVEVILVAKNSPQSTVTLAVVDYIPPRGPFKNHTLKGRMWLEDKTQTVFLHPVVQKKIEVYSSDQWWISTVIKYPTPGRSISSFHGIDDQNGWSRVEEFMNQMQSGERGAVRHFKYEHDGRYERPAAAGPAGPSPSCARHHNHYRNPYQPPKPSTVFFRVAGDEIGEKAFLVQAEKQVKAADSKPPTLEEFLEGAEKKGSAEGASASNETPSAISNGNEGVSGKRMGKGEAVATDNGSDNLPDYDPELDDLVGYKGFGLGFLPGLTGFGGIPLSSSIERILRQRFPQLAHPAGKRGKNILH
jgi:hypothetical protein